MLSGKLDTDSISYKRPSVYCQCFEHSQFQVLDSDEQKSCLIPFSHLRDLDVDSPFSMSPNNISFMIRKIEIFAHRISGLSFQFRVRRAQQMSAEQSFEMPFRANAEEFQFEKA